MTIDTNAAGSGFPAKGEAWPVLEAQLRALKKQDFDWRAGRVPSLVHYFNDEVHHVAERAYLMFMAENALGAGKAFPSLAILEDELREMVLALFHAPASAGVTFTSGGTESLLLAVKAARDHARETRGTTRPNVVGGLSAHPALNKAGQLFDVEIRRVPLGADWRCHADVLAPHIDRDTVMLFASAPCYPYGVFDDIVGIAQVAREGRLPLHVDACWGGFISPFARELGYPIPAFDLEVEGVTSLSADLHKYAYAPKGCSALMFRDADWLRHAGFRFEWVRGIYETPSLAGSRPGGVIAGAWAVMKYLGREGYREATRLAMTTTDRLREGLSTIEGLLVEPARSEANLFLYSSVDPRLNIDAVADGLKARGWYPGRIRVPLGIHHAVAPVHAQIVEQYVADVRDIAAIVRRQQLSGQFDERSY